MNGAEGDSVTEDKLVSVEAGGKDPQRLQDNEEFPLNMPDIACLAWPPRKS